MNKFSLGLLAIALASAVAFPASVGAVKADSYYKEFSGPELLSTSPDLVKMKDEIIYADYFHHLELLGEKLSGIYDKQSIAFHEINYLNVNFAQFVTKETLDQLTTDRNEIAASLQYIKDPAAAKILSNYLSSINKYKTANQYLLKYQKQKTQYNYSMFVNNTESAFKLSVTYKKQAQERYAAYIEKPVISLTDFTGQ